MVSVDTSRRKTNRWLRSSVYRVRFFRVLRAQQEENKNPGQRKRIEQKLNRIQKKIDYLTEQGKELGLSEDQIRRINLEIVDRTKRGESAKIIIQNLEKSQI